MRSECTEPMNSLAVFLSPLAVLLPAVAGGLPGVPANEGVARATPEAEKPAMGFDAAGIEPFRIVEEARRPPVQQQVRIEQRVIIRIAPSSPAARERMLAALPRRSSETKFRERKLDGCIDVEAIAGVAPAEQNRLLLFMRDRRILTAALERACNPQDYYSGFYVERNDDGQICARRDRLQSRAGASCQVSQLNRLVAVRD